MNTLFKSFVSLSIVSLCCGLVACNREYTSKPKAFPRVIYPERKYVLYNPADCPFKFEIPAYAHVEVDSEFFGHKAEPCWLNIQLPVFNGTLNLTYKAINKENSYQKLLEDAHTLTYKHSKKADNITEIGIANSHGVGGVLYDVPGEAASNVQFYLTDSVNNFLRCALYFNNEVNVDSMAPVQAYVKEDIRHMIETFQWK